MPGSYMFYHHTLSVLDFVICLICAFLFHTIVWETMYLIIEIIEEKHLTNE